MSLDQNWFLETISGKRTGFFAAIARSLLFLASLVYRLAITLRNWFYESGLLKTHRVTLPVISIGNLTTGGTGKTPFVIWLSNRLNSEPGVTVLSRGYGSTGNELNDEGREIRAACPAVHQIQNPDRVAAAQGLDPSQTSVIILDDGFQHRRLHRDLDIVLIDALNPFGYGALLPRGLLREPISSIQRSDLVLLTRSNLVSDEVRCEIRKQLQRHHHDLVWAEAELRTNGWKDVDGQDHELSRLADRKLFVFSAIGNPAGFVQTLQQDNFVLAGERRFADHHRYSMADFEQIERDAQEQNSDAIVCTMKDYVKIGRQWKPEIPVYALTTGIEIVTGADQLDQLIVDALPKLKNPR